MAGSAQAYERPTGHRGESCARVVRANGVAAAVDDEHRTPNAISQRAHSRLVAEPGRELGRYQRLDVGLQRPAGRLRAAWSSGAR